MRESEARSKAAPLGARAVPRAKSRFRETAEAIAVALLLALAIRTFIVQAFKIPSGSMLQTLQIGDHILVNKFLFGLRFEVPFTQLSLGQLPGLREPRPGDVVVFIWPKDRSKDFIKRVIAVGGETVEIRDRQVLVNGRRRDDPHATWSARGGLDGSCPFGCKQPYVVPRDAVFVMGDNRDQSYDSRFWGPVPVADIKGEAIIIYWSWDGPDRWVRWDRLGRLVY
jgi:signal peptidase I